MSSILSEKLNLWKTAQEHLQKTIEDGKTRLAVLEDLLMKESKKVSQEIESHHATLNEIKNLIMQDISLPACGDIVIYDCDGISHWVVTDTKQSNTDTINFSTVSYLCVLHPANEKGSPNVNEKKDERLISVSLLTGKIVNRHRCLGGFDVPLKWMTREDFLNSKKESVII